MLCFVAGCWRAGGLVALHHKWLMYLLHLTSLHDVYGEPEMKCSEWVGPEGVAQDRWGTVCHVCLAPLGPPMTAEMAEFKQSAVGEGATRRRGGGMIGCLLARLTCIPPEWRKKEVS